jgi:DNA-binding LytR/AlgR family response regulator
MNLNVLIIEDEALAADRLEGMIREIAPDFNILAKIGSVKEAVKWLTNHSAADLIFLDIQLSDGLSFNIFEQVTVQTPVIFTTAYDQYAIKAFQLNSIAYLLKPIRKDELMDSLQKYKSFKSAFSIDFERLLANLQGKKPEYKKRFLIQTGEKIRKVEISDIAWFYALDKGVYLRTFQNQSFPAESSLDSLEQLVDPAQFFRINRKYFVNMEAIANMVAWSRGRIKLELKPKADDEFDSVVSIDRASDFRKWLNS